MLLQSTDFPLQHCFMTSCSVPCIHPCTTSQALSILDLQGFCPCRCLQGQTSRDSASPKVLHVFHGELGTLESVEREWNAFFQGAAVEGKHFLIAFGGNLF